MNVEIAIFPRESKNRRFSPLDFNPVERLVFRDCLKLLEECKLDQHPNSGSTITPMTPECPVALVANVLFFGCAFSFGAVGFVDNDHVLALPPFPKLRPLPVLFAGIGSKKSLRIRH